MSLADGLRSCFRETEMLHLAGLIEVFDRTRYVFDGDVGVDPVLVKQVYDVNAQAFQGGFGYPTYVLRAAIYPTHFSILNRPGDD